MSTATKGRRKNYSFYSAPLFPFQKLIIQILFVNNIIKLIRKIKRKERSFLALYSIVAYITLLLATYNVDAWHKYLNL